MSYHSIFEQQRRAMFLPRTCKYCTNWKLKGEDVCYPHLLALRQFK